MIINLEELELGGKKVLIRQDLNVPIKAGVVTSDKRIKASLPTIEMAMKQGAKVMLMSHRGRPIEGEARFNRYI
jgi:phosphoglycerate kinase